MAYSETRIKYPLSILKIHKKVIQSQFLTVFALIFIVPSIAFFLFSRDTTSTGYFNILMHFISSWDMQAFLVLVVIYVLASYISQYWYFKTYFYDFTPEHIIIRKGTITRNEVTISYDKIQDIYISQDTLDRLFGLYDVHLSSATFTSSQLAHIDGVSKASAEGLKAELLSKIQK